MKRWFSIAIPVLALVWLASPMAGAASSQGPRLTGNLSNAGQAAVLAPQSNVSIVLGPEGRVTLTAGLARGLTDRRQQATVLGVNGFGLEPGGRYMVLAGSSPVASFTADDNGRNRTNLFAGTLPAQVKGRSCPAVSKLSTPHQALRVVPLATGYASTKDGTDPAGDYFDWTPLCGAENTYGETSVSEAADQSWAYFTVWGGGLTAGTTYTWRANGVDIGSVVADDWGNVWADAAAGEPPWGMPDRPAAMFVLPEQLQPVSGIAAVELAVATTVALAGNFAEPCMEEPPWPVEAGSIALCNDGTFRPWGYFDWVIFDNGLQAATLSAYELEPGIEVSVALNDVAAGTVTVGADGSLWIAYSSEPGTGELPLPAEVLPVSGVTEVVVADGDGQALLSGTPDGAGCGWIEPIESGWTSLCPLDGGTPDPAGRFYGDVGWSKYDSGLEELWVSAYGLEPSTEHSLVVDGFTAGTFTSDEWGNLWVTFSSEPAYPWQLPLPAEMSPVNDVDDVSLDVGGTPVMAGSFTEPCQPPLPPPPVAEGWTWLCAADATTWSGGDVGFTVYEDAREEMWVNVYGLAANAEASLTIDGFGVGVFTTDAWGSLYLSFSSDPYTGQLPLPEEIQPLVEMDQVVITVADVVVLSGSFMSPCEPPIPPMPEMGYTSLCPLASQPIAGDVLWTVWPDGLEELTIMVYPLFGIGTPPAAEATYSLVVDGHDLGTFTTDASGSLYLFFSSDPQWEGQLQLPEELRPVSDVDAVELRDSSATAILAGSFSDPCTIDITYETAFTGLCTGDGTQLGVAGWWTSELFGIPLDEGIEIMAWPADPNATYSVEIDGVAVGTMWTQEWWPGTVILTLSNQAGVVIPPELLPLSSVDVVKVLDGTGATVMEGSFTSPCASGFDVGYGGLDLPTPKYLRTPRASRVR